MQTCNEHVVKMSFLMKCVVDVFTKHKSIHHIPSLSIQTGGRFVLDVEEVSRLVWHHNFDLGKINVLSTFSTFTTVCIQEALSIFGQELCISHH